MHLTSVVFTFISRVDLSAQDMHGCLCAAHAGRRRSNFIFTFSSRHQRYLVTLEALLLG